jgi:hypothetical protein
MTFDSASLLQQLQELQQQIARAPLYGAALDAARNGDVHKARYATIDAQRHVRAMAITTSRIKAQVVPADGLGAALESLSELGLRAPRRVVLAELDMLRDEHGRSRAPSWEPFAGIEDLTVYACGALDGITGQWLGYRGLAAVDRDAYRAALGESHAAMRHLGGASKFARFLRRGQIRTDRPALQAACARMHAAMTIRIDGDPDLPLLVFAQPLHEFVAERAS